MGPDLYLSVQDVVADLTDVTLADNDANSILTAYDTVQEWGQDPVHPRPQKSDAP